MIVKQLHLFVFIEYFYLIDNQAFKSHKTSLTTVKTQFLRLKSYARANQNLLCYLNQMF